MGEKLHSGEGAKLGKMCSLTWVTLLACVYQARESSLFNSPELREVIAGSRSCGFLAVCVLPGPGDPHWSRSPPLT